MWTGGRIKHGPAFWARGGACQAGTVPRATDQRGCGPIMITGDKAKVVPGG